MELISADNGMSPSWSPDGASVAFLSNRAEGWDLYTVSADGGDATRITSGATVDQPAWSPDGRWIAFERGRNIEIVRPDGSERRVMVESAGSPTWSPTMQLAFVRDRDLHVREAGGSERLLLRDVDQPHWSPDGRTIAFARRGICALDVASGAVAQVTHNPADESAVIAADGDILFVRSGRIMIAHPDGSFSDLPHLPSPAGSPSPHPRELDQIAFHVHIGGNWDIATASLERGEVRTLTQATWTSWNARA